MKAVGRGLFLDLDGTVIVTKSGKTFAENKDDWKFNRNIIERIGEYVDKGYFIMIVSNQGGIESGLVLLNDFRYKIRQIKNEIIANTGCPFSRIADRFCLSNSKDDFYRKPNPGMGYDLAMSYILDLSQSLMVGDASGKVRSKAIVYKDETSKTGWSSEGGYPLSEKDAMNVVPGKSHLGTLEVRDFSDSDLRFAKSCGMEYLDVDDFLNPPGEKQLKLGL